jgi:ATP-dependent exoDNAse (exonuclease V) beta subunit
VGEPSPQLKKAITGGFDNLVKEAIDLYDENILNHNTINAILSNIYALGILSDVLRKVREVAYNNNIFLISDAGELLNLIINGDQTPYIYEKIGNRYENFMIDEFQDTSILQWNNFDPLIQNSMAGGYDNLVVGDVKQSIYRFRNSDWKILGHLLENEAGNKRIFSVPLKTNYRSRSNIITFNNSLFSIIPELIDRYFIGEPGCIQFKKLYAEAVQDDPGKAGGGYVRLDFVEDNSENEEVKESEISDHVNSTSRTGARWQDSVLERLPSVIEAFQDKGFKASEIGILVRDRREGADVLNTIIEYSINCPVEKKSAYNYNIVSNDSLTLSNSDAITFIISVLKVIIEPEDNISRALMERSYLLASGSGNSETVSRFRGNNIMGSPGFFPDDYEKFIAKAGNMTLFDATENIIGFFGLGSYPSNVPYLTTFQDLILEYSKSKNTDFHSFIEWWETSGELKSVVLPSGQDAIKVFTIHKSKGLEFPVVILPFLAWNLDHKPSRQPILWAKPPYPFNDLGIVPLRYGSGLSDTLFADRYNEERYSSYLDNVNLLYVAMTRAIDAMYGFIPDKPGTNNGIAKIIKESLLSETNPAGDSGIVMNRYYDKEKKMFEFGEIPVNYHKSEAREEITLNGYSVEERPRSLRLKLHSENYFLPGRDSARKKISYGQIMHEVFEGINSMEDIEVAVRQLVLEGKISEAESLSLILRLKNQVSEPPVSDWFKPGNRLMKEAGILLPSGSLKRPDRIIFKDDRTVIVDFKFGEENPLYINQIRQYQNILIEMGYKNTEAFLWYVDNNKIVIV